MFLVVGGVEDGVLAGALLGAHCAEVKLCLFGCDLLMV